MMEASRGRTVRQRIVLLPRIRELRIARAHSGASVKEIARELGISRWHVQAVMNGATHSTPIATALAGYFDRPLEELFFEVDLENPPSEASAA